MRARRLLWVRVASWLGNARTADTRCGQVVLTHKRKPVLVYIQRAESKMFGVRKPPTGCNFVHNDEIWYFMIYIIHRKGA